MLVAAKHGECHKQYAGVLSELSTAELEEYLHSDQLKMAFWINVYNAAIIQVLEENPVQGRRFYTNKILHLKDIDLSFDDIEHGILRKSKYKYSLGYWNKFSIPNWEKRLRVDRLDPRVHFALNCGANSCPPISNYKVEDLEEKLDENAKGYLAEASVFAEDRKAIKVPRILLWFLADFGGYSGIRKLYRRYDLIPDQGNPKISFLAYDWSTNIDNFTADFI